MNTCFVAAGDPKRRSQLCALVARLRFEAIPIRLVAHTYAYLHHPPAALVIDQGPYLLDGDPMRIEREWPVLYKPLTVIIPEARELELEYLRAAFTDAAQQILAFEERCQSPQFAFDFDAPIVEEHYRIAAE